MIVCILALSGCSGRALANPYFENTHKNSFQEAHALFDDYHDRLSEMMEMYYPRGNQQSAMWYTDGYLASQLSTKERIYRHEFYNYHLSDDRSFMRYSQLYYVLDSTFIGGLLQSYDACNTIEEGQKCVESDRTTQNALVKHGLTYYMEDENLYLDFMFTVNQSILFHYVMYFYVDEYVNKTMEMTLHISNVIESDYEEMSYTKVIFGKSVEEYICHNCDVDDMNQGYLEWMSTEFKEAHLPYTYETNNIETFAHITVLNDHIYGDYFNGSTGELYRGEGSTGEYDITSFTKYIRNTMVVDYSSSHYRINLNEVLGWDQLVKIPDTYNQYQLYYKDDVLSEHYHVNVEWTDSEYAYFEILNHPTDDVLSLNVFGLVTPYDTQYFQDTFERGLLEFEQMITDHDLNQSYATNHERFMSLINQFRS